MKLVVQAGSDAGQEFPVSSARVTIGRDMGNDVTLHDNEVSRRHAEIQQTDEGYAIVDRGSTNGTFVNDARVEALRPVQPGDKIRLGSTILSLEEGLAAPGPVQEWAPAVERRHGALPILLGPVIAVLGIAVIILATRSGPTPTALLATPTSLTTPTLAVTPILPTATAVPSPTASSVPQATATATMVLAPLCPNPNIRITWPLPGAKLAGVVEVFGTASIDGFAFYKLEFGVGRTPATWSAIGEPNRTQARDARLGMWDTTVLPEGEYTLRLTAVDATGNYPPPCGVTVQVKR